MMFLLPFQFCFVMSTSCFDECTNAAESDDLSTPA